MILRAGPIRATRTARYTGMLRESDDTICASARMRRHGWFLIFVLFFVSACRSCERITIGETSRRVILSLPLGHDEAERKTSCPLLRVQVNGKSTLFIVDTGANGNALTSWFAADAGIATTSHSEDAVRDFAGTMLEVARSEPLNVTADGSVISRGVVGVVTNPILPRQRGIGGVLSPRSLLSPSSPHPPNYTAVLDLHADRLAVVEGSFQHDPWNGDGSLTPEGTRACETKGIYLLSAELDGTSVVLRLDTGAEYTSVFAASSVGQVLSSRVATASGGQASITQQFGWAHDVSFRAGRVAKQVPVLLIPGESSSKCKYDGLLGMDVLSHCQVVLDRERAFARCE